MNSHSNIIRTSKIRTSFNIPKPHAAVTHRLQYYWRVVYHFLLVYDSNSTLHAVSLQRELSVSSHPSRYSVMTFPVFSIRCCWTLLLLDLNFTSFLAALSLSSAGNLRPRGRFGNSTVIQQNLILQPDSCIYRFCFIETYKVIECLLCRFWVSWRQKKTLETILYCKCCVLWKWFW